MLEIVFYLHNSTQKASTKEEKDAKVGIIKV